METVLRDVRFGLRMLIKNSGVTAVAVITMALGLGANTAVFSVVNGVMLKSLPFKDPDRLVFALESNTKFPPPGISTYVELQGLERAEQVIRDDERAPVLHGEYHE